MPEDVTPGELGRRLDRIEKRVDSQFDNVTRSIENMTRSIENLQFVSRDVFQIEIRGLKERIEDLEDGKRWAFRGVVTALIFPVLVAIILALALTQ